LEPTERIEQIRARRERERLALWHQIQNEEPALADLLRELRDLDIPIHDLEYRRHDDE
jgi:hypothetical protein